MQNSIDTSKNLHYQHHEEQLEIQRNKQYNTILKYQMHKKQMESFSRQIKDALSSPNIHTSQYISKLISQEQVQFDIIKQTFQILNTTNQQKVKSSFQNFQQAVKEHKQLYYLLVNNRQKFIQRARQSSYINIRKFNEYVQSLEFVHQLRGIMALIGAFLVHLIIGASARWNMLNIFITSYYKITSQPHLMVTQDAFGAPLALFCTGVGARIGIKLFKQFGSIPTLCISILGAFACQISCSYVPNIQFFIFLSCGLYPIFAGFSFQPVIQQCSLYYNRHNFMIINAFILVGNGFGHVFYGYLNSQCFNPEDIPTQYGFYGGDLDFIARKKPECMNENALVVLVMGVGSILFLLPAILYNKMRQNRPSQKQIPILQNVCESQGQALRSGIFWIFVVIVITATGPLYFLNSNYKNQIAKFNSNSYESARALLIYNVSNAISRIFWQPIFFKVGFKWCIYICNIVSIFLMLTMRFVMHNITIYSVYYSIGGICQGGCMVAFLNFNKLVFGERVANDLPGYTWTCYSLAHLLQYIIFNIYDVSTIGYQPERIILALICGISLYLVISTTFQGSWQNNTKLLELQL